MGGASNQLVSIPKDGTYPARCRVERQVADRASCQVQILVQDPIWVQVCGQVRIQVQNQVLKEIRG